MKISLTTKFKSLPAISELKLPDFVVLFGVNGAGKTHLLQSLTNPQITNIRDENDLVLDRRKFVDNNNLAPNNSTIVSWDHLKQQPTQLSSFLSSYKQNKQTNPQFTINNVTGDQKQLKLFQKISDSANKSLDDLSAEDIFEHYPINDGMDSNDVFAQSFSQLFKRYQIRQLDNEFNEFRHQKDSAVRFLSQKQFIQKYGEAPWDFVNKIIKEAKLDYHINSPINQDRDTPFELKLINEINGAEVSFSDLSGGEKVLMSLALSLYNSNFDMEFPQILLMDEPDAPLHPSMTKQFLRVLENVFVKNKNVKVILTTHSPSTVALAPEGSLFQMNKNEPRIVKTTKDKAISILTSGVPSLSISYENRRQVFVESKNDVFFYEKIYEKLKKYLVEEISINFISSGMNGQGSSNQVREIVNKLSGYGNKSIYGIVDWDLSNSETDYVKVLGKDERYSIENYIFDPLIIAAFLLREKIITKSNLGLNESQNFIDISSLDKDSLQRVVNFIVDKVKDSANVSAESKTISLLNGCMITIPNWYLTMQGHNLEERIKTTFPALNRFRVESELKKTVIEAIIDDMPSILPKDLVDLLKKIQNHGTSAQIEPVPV